MTSDDDHVQMRETPGLPEPSPPALPEVPDRRPASARDDEPEVIFSLQLQHPVKWGPPAARELVSKLDFVRAQGLHVFQQSGSDESVGSVFRIAANLCRQPYDLLELLELEDCAAVMDYMGGVLAPLRRAAARA